MRHHRLSDPVRSRILPAILAGLLLTSAVPAQAVPGGAAEAFRLLAGSWRGGGQIRLSDGSRERISCRGSYSLRGEALAIGIRCASPSYNIDMHSVLNGSGDRVWGHWEERNFSADGNVNGRSSGSHISLSLNGTISGSMSISVSGSSHSVNIAAGGGSGLQGVSISFSKG